jgi:hypothetical protein
MLANRNGLGAWLERLTIAALALVFLGSVYLAFSSPLFGHLGLQTFSQLNRLATKLGQEPDPVQREKLTPGEDPGVGAGYRAIDARCPANARLFLAGMLGRENFSQIGYYRYLTYYLFPREVAISLGETPALHLDWVEGRSPSSAEEVRQAGYDYVMEFAAGQTRLMVTPLRGGQRLPEVKPKSIPSHDWVIALLLPLAVAVAGSRIVRWLFGDLRGVLSTGELLASGLAVGVLCMTQLTLGLRLAGLRWERALIALIMLWAVGEGVWAARCWRPRRFRFNRRQLWWLLLAPAALVLGCQFRLAGVLGLQEFDAVAIWAFKAKILHLYAGREMWTWFGNPGLAYAHMDYPLLVPLLHALTYGGLGHVNDFVIKFWNQWMLLLLAWGVLGAARFPGQRPWLAGMVVAAFVLLPMTRAHALGEGATLPMVFYVVLSSLELALGMTQRQAGRLRLGMLLLLGAAMVKFEGMLLLAVWAVLLLLDRESRATIWPPLGMGRAGLLGFCAWLPYVAFRLQGPVLHPESHWPSQLVHNAGAVFYLAPMTWVAMVSRRFLDNDFAVWSSPDNQHAVWQGQWSGWQSLVDLAAPGVGWVCVLMLGAAWFRGGRLRPMAFRLLLAFLALATMISLVWSALKSSPMNYSLAISGSDVDVGGRYLYPVLMAWFVGGAVLLLRPAPARPPDAAPN